MATTPRQSASRHTDRQDGRHKRARTDRLDDSDDETVIADSSILRRVPHPLNRPRRNSTSTLVSLATAKVALPEDAHDDLVSAWDHNTEPAPSNVLEGKCFMLASSVWKDQSRNKALKRILVRIS